MTDLIIGFIKKHPFLYNLAKRLTGRSRRSAAPQRGAVTFYGFVMNDLARLDSIKSEYEKIKKYNTSLFILVNDKNLKLCINRLIRENPDICFADFDYFRKYNKRLSLSGIVWIDYSTAQRELLEYLA